MFGDHQTESVMTKIAFIGLGNMGGPMAANLVKAGFAVRGFDLAESSKKAAVEAGVAVAPSIADVVHDAEVVVTMLPAGQHVLDVWNEIVPLLEEGTLIIDCSTIDVGSAGQAEKICNNMILGISMIGVCEAFTLGEKLGLSHQALFDVASTSSGQCWSLTSYCPVPGPVPASPAYNDYKQGFATALMLKDLRLSQEAARAASAATPLGAHAQALYQAFSEAGHGMVDFSGIIAQLRQQSKE